MGNKAYVRGVGHDDGAESKCVNSNGRKHKTVGVGCKYRSAAAEGVGCGACGGGHYEAVAGVGGKKLAIDKNIGGKECERFLSEKMELISLTVTKLKVKTLLKDLETILPNI